MSLGFPNMQWVTRVAERWFLSVALIWAGCAPTSPSLPPRSLPPPPGSGNITVPSDFQLTRDCKPPCRGLSKIKVDCGLTLAPDGLYYVLPNCIQALRWDQLDSIHMVEGTLSVATRAPNAASFSEVICLTGSKNDFWEPRLPTGEILPQLVLYSGLEPQGEGSYVRGQGAPKPPSQSRFIPLIDKPPASISVAPAKLADLPQGLGLYVNQDGVIVCQSGAIFSIGWSHFRSLEDRYRPESGDPTLFLGTHADSVPGDYEAIAVSGPEPDSTSYLAGPDFLELSRLLKSRRPPPKPRYFPLFTSQASMGKALPPPRLPQLAPVKAPRSAVSWPGAALANVHPLDSGYYVLPAGFFKVAPDSIEYTGWGEIKYFSADSLGNCRLGDIAADNHDLRRIPEMRAMAKALLEILRFEPAGPAGPWHPGRMAPIPPASGRFMAAGEGKWGWPPVHDLGDQPWEPGLHFQRDAMVACFPNFLKVYLWEDLSSHEMSDDQWWLRDGDGHGIPFPSAIRPLPREILESAWREMPLYWKANGPRNDQGEVEGESVPRHLRPTQPKHFPLPR
jgi:hypothetical protein